MQQWLSRCRRLGRVVSASSTCPSTCVWRRTVRTRWQAGRRCRTSMLRVLRRRGCGRERMRVRLRAGRNGMESPFAESSLCGCL